MKVAVYGLWHLGCVTAACLAEAGHEVVGIETEPENLTRLKSGKAPLSEPGLDDLIAKGLKSGKLKFDEHMISALKGASVLWITFDTPVDEDDRADVAFVLGKVRACLGLVDPGCLILISSQLPAGSTLGLQAEAERSRPGAGISLAYSPENLRLGKAIEVFQKPDRVVVGVSNQAAKELASQLLKPVTEKIEWMSVPSAEMTKHAINSFLALSVVFINELALLCEKSGADVKEVERGLKTEQRIGPKAYLGAGAAFAGGTLARDLEFLKESAKKAGLNPSFFESIAASNTAHKLWPRNKLAEIFGSLKGKTIGILGLAYKSGTDTLRRSQALELCHWVLAQGANCIAFDPLIKALPADESRIALSANPHDLLQACEAAVICMDWPELKSSVQALSVLPAIVDPAGVLAKTELPPATRYFRVGSPTVAL